MKESRSAKRAGSVDGVVTPGMTVHHQTRGRATVMNVDNKKSEPIQVQFWQEEELRTYSIKNFKNKFKIPDAAQQRRVA